MEQNWCSKIYIQVHKVQHSISPEENGKSTSGHSRWGNGREFLWEIHDDKLYAIESSPANQLVVSDGTDAGTQIITRTWGGMCDTYSNLLSTGLGRGRIIGVSGVVLILTGTQATLPKGKEDTTYIVKEADLLQELLY